MLMIGGDNLEVTINSCSLSSYQITGVFAVSKLLKLLNTSAVYRALFLSVAEMGFQ